VHPIELLTDPLLVSVEVFTLTININHILYHFCWKCILVLIGSSGE
jgi:hypothetical protein